MTLPHLAVLGSPALFAGFVAAALVLQWCLCRRNERCSVRAEPVLWSPYLISTLRGGELEAVRVALFVLMERGLLKRSQKRGCLEPDPQLAGLASHPLEKSLLAALRESGELVNLRHSRAVRAQAAHLTAELARVGLVAAGSRFARFRTRSARATSLVILSTGMLKLLVALVWGNSDVWFLLFFILLALLTSLAIFNARLTPAGSEVLAMAQARYARLLTSPPEKGKGGIEAAYLAATFGLVGLSRADFPFVPLIAESRLSRAGTSFATWDHLVGVGRSP